MQTLTVPQGSFQLSRFPVRNNEKLRAWDAADEYVLQALEEYPDVEQQSVLILNDRCGALSIALAETSQLKQLQMMSDSWLAHQALLFNLKNNDRQENSVKLLSSLQVADGLLDLVVIKIPKTLALLEEQLYRIRPNLHDKTRIIGAGMVKQIHTSTLKLFERILGSTQTSLAKKKARLIHCQFDQCLILGSNPYPKHYILENTTIEVTNHANVFSRDSLDIGTRFFLEHIPEFKQPLKIVDLGCGNGLLGIIAAQRNPAAELVFVDESYMAIASAQINFQTVFNTERKAEFLNTDCLTGVSESSVNLVLNNPPFHIQNAISGDVARRMFSESKKVLKKGGELWVIGNRHLTYHKQLLSLFGHYTVIASNRKFVILKAVKASV
ncbi:MAG: methyltransferase [Methylococcales bacterium]